MTADNQILPKSYKGLFPFKIGTTSYIYPDHVLPNVRRIGPYVDEIELLFFESDPDHLPGTGEISELVALSRDFDITFNVHLPLDLKLGSPSAPERRRSADVVKRLVDLASPLSPTTHTLHLEYTDRSHDETDLKSWQGRICESMNAVLSEGISPRSISIETLMYPFQWVAQIIESLNLSVCIDFGHLAKAGMRAEQLHASYGKQVAILHLHAWDGNRDHKPLGFLAEAEWAALKRVVRDFHGVVSVEVFSFDHLRSSLALLEQRLLLK